MSEQKRKYVKVAPDATERKCTKCGETKPFSAFTLRRSGRPSSWCRPCTNEAIRAYSRTATGAARKKAAQDAYNARNPDYQVGYRYGLKPGEFTRMLEDQDGLCAICHQPSEKTLHVDHDHASGAVRELLCSACNLGIGKFKDDPALLRAAADYIDRHRAER